MISNQYQRKLIYFVLLLAYPGLVFASDMEGLAYLFTIPAAFSLSGLAFAWSFIFKSISSFFFVLTLSILSSSIGLFMMDLMAYSGDKQTYYLQLTLSFSSLVAIVISIIRILIAAKNDDNENKSSQE